jgi:hypothetical protein
LLETKLNYLATNKSKARAESTGKDIISDNGRISSNLSNHSISKEIEESKIIGVLYFLVNIAMQTSIFDILKITIPDYWQYFLTLSNVCLYRIQILMINVTIDFKKIIFFISR